MKIVIAPDSFKESLSAKAVAENIAIGIKKVLPRAETLQIPISDGGEGLLEALVPPLNGTLVTVMVKDPLLRPIRAQYGILGDDTTAVVEMATASGLELLTEAEKNPMRTSTYGTGQLIIDALDKGCTKIIVGIGGSATNDGGMGMIKALGGKFLDAEGNDIGEGGGALANLHTIDCSHLDTRIAQCEFIGACDVSNPLIGPQGASMVFGAQKGGSPEQLQQLDHNLTHYANIIQKDLNKDVATIPGGGAAGGMGAALLTYFNAQLERGIDLILETLQLETHIQDADWVITGEGKIDQQTLYGKTIAGIAALAKKHHVPVIAIAGKVEPNLDNLYHLGVTATFSIVNQPMTLQEAMAQTDKLIQACVENVFRTLIA